METRLNSFYITPMGTKTITLFAYATKGVPGLEVNGISKFSKNIKEKIIFITKQRNIKIPNLRYVLCIDMNDFDERLGWAQLKWLELPLLLTYWHLAGVIKIKKLDNCFCAGEIKVTGDIIHLYPPNDLLEKINNDKRFHRWSFIQNFSSEDVNVLNSEYLFQDIPELRIKNYKQRTK